MTDAQLAILLEYVKARLEVTRADLYELLKDDLEVEVPGLLGTVKTIKELNPIDTQISELNDQIEELKK